MRLLGTRHLPQLRRKLNKSTKGNYAESETKTFQGATQSAAGPEIEGAIMAARERCAKVLLVGPQDALKQELGRHRALNLGIELVHASEAITMEDTAAKAFRQKRDSSIRVAARLVREGKA